RLRAARKQRPDDAQQDTHAMARGFRLDRSQSFHGHFRDTELHGADRQPGASSRACGRGTSNLQAGEIFKIRAGKIHEIEAMGTSLPYGMKSGWESPPREADAGVGCGPGGPPYKAALTGIQFFRPAPA